MGHSLVFRGVTIGQNMYKIPGAKSTESVRVLHLKLLYLTNLHPITLRETNIAPADGPSQKEIHLPTIDFQGLC